jgi:rubredoxin
MADKSITMQTAKHYTCERCGYRGPFVGFWNEQRLDVRCPDCYLVRQGVAFYTNH